MNVWLDVGQLGLAYSQGAYHKAGLHRVLSNVLPYLTSPTAGLAFTLFSGKPALAVSTLHALQTQVKALSSEGEGSAAFWWPKSLAEHPYFEALELLRAKVEKARNNQPAQWRWHKTLLKMAFPAADTAYTAEFPVAAKTAKAVHFMNANDVNRSYALPKHVARFVTVYDLIPLCCSVVRQQDKTLAYKQKTTLSRLTEQDWVFCISEHTRKDLLSHFPNVNPERVTLLPLAASPSFKPTMNPERLQYYKQRLNLRPEAPYLLSLSTLAVHKNTRFLIEQVLVYLTETRNTELTLWLVGAARHEDKAIAALLQRYPKAAAQIKWLGFVPDEDLPLLYTGALGFCFLSLYEGFGLPVLEAMQCGTPVLCSNTTSLPEVAGDAALMVNPTNADAVHQAINQLVNTPLLQETLAQKGLHQAKRFNWQASANVLLAQYKYVTL